MANPVPDLHPNLQGALTALRADGIIPTDAEVAWLARLRWPCDHPNDGSMSPLVGGPVDVAGEYWWPLHRLSEFWFVMAGDLFGDEGTWKTDVYLYAHIKSEPGDRSLLMLRGRDQIVEAVSTWRNGLPLHDENVPDLVRLLRHIDGYNDDIPRDRTSEPAGELDGIAQLCRMFPGTTPDYWRAGISIAETESLLESANSEKWAESHRRTDSIKTFLLAVKQVRANHGK